MQYILSEEEYKKLIHKDRIIKPIRDFLSNVDKLIKESPQAFNPRCIEVSRENLMTEFNTLSIKLDL